MMTPQSNEVRVTTRFPADLHSRLDELSDDMDRSLNWVVNRACEQFVALNTNDLSSNYPPPTPDAGVSTYRAVLEFQLPAMVWADQQAYELFFEFMEKLKGLSPNKQEAYGQIDAIRPMEYDARFADVLLPGSSSIHKANIEAFERLAKNVTTEPVAVDGEPTPRGSEPPEPVDPWTGKTAAEQTPEDWAIDFDPDETTSGRTVQEVIDQSVTD